MIPRKLELVRDYIHRINPDDTYKIIDIGGIVEYYELLNIAFSPGDVYILNNKFGTTKTKKSIAGDANHLPFKNDSCDIITSFDLIEHLINPDVFILECFRILKKEGWFILSTPNLNDFYSRITFTLGYTPFSYNPSNKFRVAVPLSNIDTNMGHKSVFPYKGLGQLLSIYGFDIIDSFGFSYTDSFYLELEVDRKGRELGFYNIRKILDKFLPKSMKEGMLFICKKG